MSFSKIFVKDRTPSTVKNATSVKMLGFQYLHMQIQEKSFKKILHQQKYFWLNTFREITPSIRKKWYK